MSKGYYEINQPTFQDSISDLAFADGQRYLAATSWEGLLCVWEFSQDYLNPHKKIEYRENKTAFLRCCFDSECSHIYFGTSQGDVKNLSLNDITPNHSAIETYKNNSGQAAPIVGLRYCTKKSLVVALTLNYQILIFAEEMITIRLNMRPICMDISNTQLLIATLGPGIWKLDLENVNANSQPTQVQTGLRYQIKSISISKNKPDRYIIGSIFGQVEICDGNNRTLLEVHRESNRPHIYSSNSVAMVGEQPLAISAGGNGLIKMINFEKQRGGRDQKFSEFPLTCVAVSSRGEVAAVAQGYDWSRGVEILNSDRKPTTALYIKKIQSNEF